VFIRVAAKLGTRLSLRVSAIMSTTSGIAVSPELASTFADAVSSQNVRFLKISIQNGSHPDRSHQFSPILYLTGRGTGHRCDHSAILNPRERFKSTSVVAGR